MEEDLDCAVPDDLAEAVILRRKALRGENQRKAELPCLPDYDVDRTIALEIQIAHLVEDHGHSLLAAMLFPCIQAREHDVEEPARFADSVRAGGKHDDFILG